MENTPLTWHTSSPEDNLQFPPEEVFEAGLRHFQIANTAYPINHNKTIKPYRVPESKIQDHMTRIWSEVDELLLYAHVPFCASICAFCELSVVKPKYNDRDRDPYFDALQKEIALYRERL